MCWWSYTKPPKGNPLPVGLSPLAQVLEQKSWFLRALCLYSLAKEKQWPCLQVSSTWKSVYLQCESDSLVSEQAANRILSWNFTPNLFFLSSPASTIDSCRKCWQTLVLLLTQLPASGDIPTNRSTSHTCVHALCFLQTCSSLIPTKSSTTAKTRSEQKLFQDTMIPPCGASHYSSG